MKHIVLVLIGVVLSGCSSLSMNRSFSCGVGEGLGCKSVSEVSDIVDSSNITNDRVIQGSQDDLERSVFSMIGYYEGASNNSMPEREPEKRLRIWFAPHIDDYDNFVEETVVYSVVKEARWVY